MSVKDIDVETYPGFTYEYRENIYFYRVFEISRAAVDAWFETDIAQMQTALTTTRHVLRLVHLTRLIFPTPYFTARLRESNNVTPNTLFESTAMLVSSAMVYNTMRPFINRDLSNINRNARQLFSNEARALAWLKQRQDYISGLVAAGQRIDDDSLTDDSVIQ